MIQRNQWTLIFLARYETRSQKQVLKRVRIDGETGARKTILFYYFSPRASLLLTPLWSPCCKLLFLLLLFISFTVVASWHCYPILFFASTCLLPLFSSTHFPLCISFFPVSLLSAHLIFFTFFYSLFSSLHFLIPAKHGWRLWTCWWLLFRSENQLRNSRDNQCMVLKAARHHFSGWNSSISSLWPGQELQYFSCFLGDPGVHSRGWQQDCR